jgi:hypothetical protein
LNNFIQIDEEFNDVSKEIKRLKSDGPMSGLSIVLKKLDTPALYLDEFDGYKALIHNPHELVRTGYNLQTGKHAAIMVQAEHTTRFDIIKHWIYNS